MDPTKVDNGPCYCCVERYGLTSCLHSPDGPYEAWFVKGDPEPMILWIERVIKARKVRNK